VPVRGDDDVFAAIE
jgi:hypothetical protein